MKDIKDYLHLYLGCDCMIGDLSWKREEYTYGLMPDVDLDYGKPIKSKLDAHVLNAFAHKTTLILRPLSDMTEEEAKEIVFLRSPTGSVKDSDAIVIVESMTDGKRIKWHFQDVPNIPRYANVNELGPRQFRFLLSSGFDLFGLIEAGLAIDKTTLKQTA